MAWIESHQELREHPKTKRLCRLLALPRPMVVGYLHFLWWWAYDYAPEGDLSPFTDEDIADAVDWDGDPGELMRALVQAGFVNEDRRLHDWADFAQKWIERRRADRERKRAGTRKEQTVQRTSTGVPAEIRSHSGVTGPDRTIPDLTKPDSSPQPPPQAEGENPPTPRKRGARSGQRGGFAAVSERPSDPVGGDGVAVEDLAPPTVVDMAGWAASRECLRPDLSAEYFQRVILSLELIGRGSDGGMRLRAPPGLGATAQRFRQHIARALLEAGDPAGARVVIVEARPGQE